MAIEREVWIEQELRNECVSEETVCAANEVVSVWVWWLLKMYGRDGKKTSRERRRGPGMLEVLKSGKGQRKQDKQ